MRTSMIHNGVKITLGHYPSDILVIVVGGDMDSGHQATNVAPKFSCTQTEYS